MRNGNLVSKEIVHDSADVDEPSEDEGPTHEGANERNVQAESAPSHTNSATPAQDNNQTIDRDEPMDTSAAQSPTNSSGSTSTSSTTPTTADVADIESTIQSPAMQNLAQKAIKRSQLTYLRPQVQNAVEDNLSTSVATTITDGDVEHSVTTTNNHYNTMPHPSVAFADTNMVYGSTILPMDTNLVTAGHRRTHSTASYISVRSIHVTEGAQPRRTIKGRMQEFMHWCSIVFQNSGIGDPCVHHALVVIFLEFFSWGLLTMPIISILHVAFPHHTFLMNGLMMGIKGILSFLSAPLIGALSDIWGRKFFLLFTVFFTCLPIPFMPINYWWFFAMISISGAFAVTFSVVFAYVADVTTQDDRSRAYGLASATFAASLVISPALGNVLMDMYGDNLVVALSTAIAALDVFFILVAVPESLPDKMRPAHWGSSINWQQADPFAALRKVGSDRTILMLCFTVLFAYLPESGQYSSMFVYLKLKMNFNNTEVSLFIAMVGILSITVQVTLGAFMQIFGAKRTIILGLSLEFIQLLWYGLGTEKWMMWPAGIIAACGSISYPAISAFVSLHASPESQGAVQGILTGMRGLCNGLGPAIFGIIFYLFDVELSVFPDSEAVIGPRTTTEVAPAKEIFCPGPPFLFGAMCALLAIMIACFIPEVKQPNTLEKKRKPSEGVSLDVQYEIEHGHKAPSSLAPLIRSDSLAQL